MLTNIKQLVKRMERSKDKLGGETLRDFLSTRSLLILGLYFREVFTEVYTSRVPTRWPDGERRSRKWYIDFLSLK